MEYPVPLSSALVRSGFAWDWRPRTNVTLLELWHSRASTPCVHGKGHFEPATYESGNNTPIYAITTPWAAPLRTIPGGARQSQKATHDKLFGKRRGRKLGMWVAIHRQLSAAVFRISCGSFVRHFCKKRRSERRRGRIMYGQLPESPCTGVPGPNHFSLYFDFNTALKRNLIWTDWTQDIHMNMWIRIIVSIRWISE